MGDGPALEEGAKAGHSWAIDEIEKNRPSVDYPFHWLAFHKLSKERQIGMTPGPIPDSAILAYARRYKLSREETALLEHVIDRADNHYLSKLADKMDKAKS